MSFNIEEYRAGMENTYGPDWKEILRAGARKGGSVKVSKGLGKLSPEKRLEISRLGVEARRLKNAAKSD